MHLLKVEVGKLKVLGPPYQPERPLVLLASVWLPGLSRRRQIAFVEAFVWFFAPLDGWSDSEKANQPVPGCMTSVSCRIMSQLTNEWTMQCPRGVDVFLLLNVDWNQLERMIGMLLWLLFQLMCSESLRSRSKYLWKDIICLQKSTLPLVVWLCRYIYRWCRRY